MDVIYVIISEYLSRMLMINVSDFLRCSENIQSRGQRSLTALASFCVKKLETENPEKHGTELIS